MIVVESEGEISGGFKIVSGNAAARITLLVDRRESVVGVPMLNYDTM